MYDGNGIGDYDYDLADVRDRAFAFDYSSSGNLDHIALYRPGEGTFWVLRNNAGAFTPVFISGEGIGGYGLKDPRDQAFAFDFSGNGRLDHVALYRPGSRASGGGAFWLLRNQSGAFTPVYTSGDGIGGYDLGFDRDRAFAFDYDGQGTLDHIALYRPGEGTFWVVRNNAGAFITVYASGQGIGDVRLRNKRDVAFAFDYSQVGTLDHVVIYRPQGRRAWVVRRA